MNKNELRTKYLSHIKNAKVLESMHDITPLDSWNIFTHYAQALYWRTLLTIHIISKNLQGNNT